MDEKYPNVMKTEAGMTKNAKILFGWAELRFFLAPDDGAAMIRRFDEIFAGNDFPTAPLTVFDLFRTKDAFFGSP